MIQTIVSVGVLAAAVGVAYWFMQRSEERRSARDRARALEERRDLSQQTGLAPGDRPLCPPNNPGCRNRQILDDGLAGNSPWVDTKFRTAFWGVIDRGGSTADAFLAGMSASKWRAGSRGQVLDRLVSHRLMDMATRNRLTAEYLATLPHGHGPFE